MVIGVTGNIGSGKTLAVAYLRELGAAIILADQVGHSVLEPGAAAYRDVVNAFGQSFLDKNGWIDRKKLGAYIFSDVAGKRVALLNQLTHPHIQAKIQQQIDTFRSQGYDIIVIESALLADSPLINLIDQLWLIRTSPELATRRAALRDHCAEDEIWNRRQAQRDQNRLAAQADVVIDNNGSPEELREQIKQQYLRIKNMED